MHYEACVKLGVGEGAGPSRNRGRKERKKQIFRESFKFPNLNSRELSQRVLGLEGQIVW